MITAMLITSVHLACLSQLESGDDDFAVSSTGCMSRYQISPKIWFDKAGTQDPHNSKIAMIVAKKLWQARVNQFTKTHQRNPTLEELALLWHHPMKVDRPTDADWDYAVRFQNLIEKYAKAASQAKD
jgi:hypothetical protein